MQTFDTLCQFHRTCAPSLQLGFCWIDGMFVDAESLISPIKFMQNQISASASILIIDVLKCGICPCHSQWGAHFLHFNGETRRHAAPWWTFWWRRVLGPSCQSRQSCSFGPCSSFDFGRTSTEFHLLLVGTSKGCVGIYSKGITNPYDFSF